MTFGRMVALTPRTLVGRTMPSRSSRAMPKILRLISRGSLSMKRGSSMVSALSAFSKSIVRGPVVLDDSDSLVSKALGGASIVMAVGVVAVGDSVLFLLMICGRGNLGL